MENLFKTGQYAELESLVLRCTSSDAQKRPSILQIKAELDAIYKRSQPSGILPVPRMTINTKAVEKEEDEEEEEEEAEEVDETDEDEGQYFLASQFQKRLVLGTRPTLPKPKASTSNMLPVTYYTTSTGKVYHLRHNCYGARIAHTGNPADTRLSYCSACASLAEHNAFKRALRGH